MRHATTIRLANRQIAILITIVIVMLVFSFGAGYYWGEKKAAARFLQRIGQESFGDQVYSSICSLYDSDSDVDPRTENGSSGETSQSVSKEIEEGVEKGKSNADEPQSIYYAQLVGFGTVAKAKQFADRLNRKGITAYVRERKSKSARGRLIAWYQVVTEPYSNKSDLIALVEELKRNERLHDVRIVTI